GRFAPGNKLGKRYKPGESGNPNGRPKRTRLTEALLAQLEQTAPNEDTVAECIARALILEALKGNVQAIREIGDRTEGKPRQQLDVNANVLDWREMARQAGVNETDVLEEAKRIIESTDVRGGAARNRA